MKLFVSVAVSYCALLLMVLGTQRKHREHTDQTNENQTTREADRQIER